MLYNREKYVTKLLKKRNNDLIKVITGIRRVGKSFLLNELFKKKLLEEGMKEENIISFAFDSASDLKKIGEDLLDIKEKNKKVDPHKFLNYVEGLIAGDGPYVLLLDEIQELGNFEAVLNGYLRQKNVDVYVTGSNAHTLSTDVATEFAKRGDEVKVYPLSFSEFYAGSSKEKKEALDEYLRFGGMPTVVSKEDETEKMEELASLLDKVYISDVIIRNNVINQAGLSSLLNMMASYVGTLANPQRVSIQAGGMLSSPTIAKYLHYFEDAFVIEECNRYDIKGKAYIDTPQKYYFEDTGLRNSRLGFRQYDSGHLFENMVYLELKRRGYSVDVGTLYVSEPNVNGNYVRKEIEIDFVAKKGGKDIFIQCCDSLPQGDKEESEKRGLRKINNSFKKVLLVNDYAPNFYDNDGILTLGVFDFLLDDLSLDKY